MCDSQRRRIADANTNSYSYSYSHCYANSYSYSDRNCHSNGDAYCYRAAEIYAIAEASPNSAAPTVGLLSVISN